MSFIFAHNDETEIDRARSVLSTLGMWYGCVQTRMPSLFDLEDPGAAIAASWNAKLASIEFRNMVSGPVVTVQNSLKISAFHDLPGTAFPLIFRMFSPSELVYILDSRAILDRQCAFEIGLAYVDIRPTTESEILLGDPDFHEKTFVHGLTGRIVNADELRFYGTASNMLDVFIPEGEHAPYSRLLPSRQDFYAKHFEEVYMTFAQWYHDTFLVPAQRHAVPVEARVVDKPLELHFDEQLDSDEIPIEFWPPNESIDAQKPFSVPVAVKEVADQVHFEDNGTYSSRDGTLIMNRALVLESIEQERQKRPSSNTLIGVSPIIIKQQEE